MRDYIPRKARTAVSQELSMFSRRRMRCTSIRCERKMSSLGAYAALEYVLPLFCFLQLQSFKPNRMIANSPFAGYISVPCIFQTISLRAVRLSESFGEKGYRLCLLYTSSMAHVHSQNWLPMNKCMVLEAAVQTPDVLG